MADYAAQLKPLAELSSKLDAEYSLIASIVERRTMQLVGALDVAKAPQDTVHAKEVREVLLRELSVRKEPQSFLTSVQDVVLDDLAAIQRRAGDADRLLLERFEISRKCLDVSDTFLKEALAYMEERGDADLSPEKLEHSREFWRSSFNRALSDYALLVRDVGIEHPMVAEIRSRIMASSGPEEGKTTKSSLE